MTDHAALRAAASRSFERSAALVARCTRILNPQDLDRHDSRRVASPRGPAFEVGRSTNGGA